MFKKISTAVKGVVNEIGGNVAAAGGKKTKTVTKNTPDPTPAPTTTNNTPDPTPAPTTIKNTPDPTPAPVPSKAGTTYSGATSEAGMSFLSGGLIGGTIGAVSSGSNGSSGSVENSGSGSGNMTSGNTTGNTNGNETDQNAQVLIISTIIVIYTILKILQSKKSFLQKMIFIGIAIVIYFYFYQDPTDSTDQ